MPGQERADTAFDMREREVRQSIHTEAVSLANVILDGLADPNSGAEAYENGTGFLNKPAIIGPDLEYPTADDRRYRDVPEMFARLEPNGEIVFSAVKIREDGNTSYYDSAQLIFATRDPVDTDGNRQISLEELRSAVADGSTELVAATLGEGKRFGEEHVGNDDGRTVSLRITDGSILTSETPGYPPDTNDSSLAKQVDGVGELNAIDEDFGEVAKVVAHRLTFT